MIYSEAIKGKNGINISHVLESLRSRFTEIGMQQMCWAVLRSYTYKGVNETGLERS